MNDMLKILTTQLDYTRPVLWYWYNESQKKENFNAGYLVY